MKTTNELVTESITRLSKLPPLPPRDNQQPSPMWCACGEEWEEPGDGARRYKKCRACWDKEGEEHWRKVCPPLYQETDLDRLPAAQMKKANAWHYGPTGWLMVGETGLTKSRVAWATIRRVFQERPGLYLGFVFLDCVAFDHEIQRRYQDETGIVDWVDALAQKPLIFFDDFGKLKLSERSETELFALIERRCANKLPTCATTNDSGDTLAARMTSNRGPSMIRRLREFCQVIQF